MDDCAEITFSSKIIGWDMQYQQCSRGKLCSDHAVGTANNLRFGSTTSNRGLLGHGTPPAGHVALLMPLTLAAPALFNCEEFTPGQVAIMVPGSENYYRNRDHFQHLSFCLPLELLRSIVQLEQACAVEPLLRYSHVISITPAQTMQLSRLVWQALAHLAGDLELANSSSLLAEVEREIAGALVQILSAAKNRGNSSLAIRQRLKYFRRSRDFIEAQLGNRLTLDQIARETAISQRSLRTAFQQVTGMSPSQYIKSRRLAEVHHQLLALDPAETQVTDIALRCGFSHMGYFARDYRNMYGQLPRETLHQF